MEKTKENEALRLDNKNLDEKLQELTRQNCGKFTCDIVLQWALLNSASKFA